MMNRLVPAFGLVAVTLAVPLVSMAQMARTDTEHAFRFELAPTEGHRGLGVEGDVYHASVQAFDKVMLEALQAP